MKSSLSLFAGLAAPSTTTLISVVPPSYSTQSSQHKNSSSVTPSDIKSYFSVPASLSNPVTPSATDVSAPAGGTIDSIVASMNFLVNHEERFTPPTITLSDENPSPTDKSSFSSPPDKSGFSSPPPLVCYHYSSQGTEWIEIAWNDEKGKVTSEPVDADNLPAEPERTCQLLYDNLRHMHQSRQLSEEDSKKVDAYVEYLTSERYAVPPGTDDWILGGKPGRGGANLQIGLGVGIPLFCLCIGAGWGLCRYCVNSRRQQQQQQQDRERQVPGQDDAVELEAP